MKTLLNYNGEVFDVVKIKLDKRKWQTQQRNLFHNPHARFRMHEI